MLPLAILQTYLFYLFVRSFMIAELVDASIAVIVMCAPMLPEAWLCSVVFGQILHSGSWRRLVGSVAVYVLVPGTGTLGLMALTDYPDMVYATAVLLGIWTVSLRHVPTVLLAMYLQREAFIQQGREGIQ